MSIEYRVRRGQSGYFVQYKCPRCSSVLQSSLSEAGTLGSCPDCHLALEIPGKKEAEAEATRKAAGGGTPPQVPLPLRTTQEPNGEVPRLSPGARTVISTTYGLMLAAAAWVGLSFAGTAGRAETVLQQNAAAAEACAMLLFLYAVARGIEKLARVSCGL